MNWKLVFCAAALPLLGCGTSEPNQNQFGEYGFTYDLVEPPIPGVNYEQFRGIMRSPPVSSADLMAIGLTPAYAPAFLLLPPVRSEAPNVPNTPPNRPDQIVAPTRSE